MCVRDRLHDSFECALQRDYLICKLAHVGARKIYREALRIDFYSVRVFSSAVFQAVDGDDSVPKK